MQKFTVKQSCAMAKTLREVIHCFGLTKAQLQLLSKEFNIITTRGLEDQLIIALNHGRELDWKKKRN